MNKIFSHFIVIESDVMWNVIVIGMHRYSLVINYVFIFVFYSVFKCLSLKYLDMFRYLYGLRLNSKYIDR